MRRSLFLHASLPRRPHAVLSAMLARVDADTPADGADGPQASQRTEAQAAHHDIAARAGLS